MSSIDFDSGLVIFDPLLERLLAYNDSAATVWNAIKNGASIESVSTVLPKTYGISAEQSSKDATLVIQHWAESNLLEGATVAPFRAAAAPLISAAADLTFKPDIGPGRSVFYRINEYCFRTTIFERSIAQGLERLLSRRETTWNTMTIPPIAMASSIARQNT